MAEANATNAVQAPALLVFPPGWTAYAPYLALPALAAAARRGGHSIDLLDLNVEYYDSVLSRENLRERLQQCQDRLRAGPSWQERRRLSAALAYGYLADQIEGIKSRVRDRTAYPSQTYAKGLLE